MHKWSTFASGVLDGEVKDPKTVERSPFQGYQPLQTMPKLSFGVLLAHREVPRLIVIYYD